MEQLQPDPPPSEGTAHSGGTTRRSLLGGAMAATAAGALGGPLSIATAGEAQDTEIRQYSLPRGAYRMDLHSHFLPREYQDYMTRNGFLMPPWSAEEHIRFMDTWGIQKSVVAVPHFHIGNQAETNELARKINEAGRALLDDHGDRFAVHAALPLPDVTASLAELSYAFDVLELDGGVMLSTQYDGTYVGDPAYDELYAELDRRGSVVWLHPMFPEEEPVGPFPGTILEFPFETTRAAGNLIYHGLPRRFPNIRWQLSHVGGTLPFLLFRLALMQISPELQTIPPAGPGTPVTSEGAPDGPFAEAKKFWYDTATAGSEEQLLSIDHLTGAPKVVFGSDWPFTRRFHSPTAHTLAPWWSDQLPKDGDPQPALSRVFEREERISIERGNALELYPALASGR